MQERNENDVNFSEDCKEWMCTSEALYLQEIAKIPFLSKEEEYLLSIGVLENDASSISYLIESFLPLVVHIAKKYIGVGKNYGFSFLDIVQEGNLGLMKAAQNFDVTKDCCFLNYAYFWIFKFIKRAFASKGKKFKLSVERYERLEKYRQCYQNLQQRYHRSPTISELAKELSFSEGQISELEFLDTSFLSWSYLLQEEFEFGSQIPSPLNLEEDYLSSQLGSDLETLFQEANLTSKEIAVLRFRFDFYGIGVLTQEEVGQILGGVTRARIAQIETSALKKIRDCALLLEFVPYALYPAQAQRKLVEYWASSRDKKSSDFIFDGKVPRERKKEKIENFVPSTKRHRKAKKTIYELVGGTKEEVDLLIETELFAEEKHLIWLGNGSDLLHPMVQEGFGNKERSKLYGSVLPKIKRLLTHPEGVMKKRSACEKLVKSLDIYSDGYFDEEFFQTLWEVLSSSSFSELLQQFSRHKAILFLINSFSDEELKAKVFDFVETKENVFNEICDGILHQNVSDSDGEKLVETPLVKQMIG